jgi:hypothetical protein
MLSAQQPEWARFVHFVWVPVLITYSSHIESKVQDLQQNSVYCYKQMATVFSFLLLQVFHTQIFISHSSEGILKMETSSSLV